MADADIPQSAQSEIRRVVLDVIGPDIPLSTDSLSSDIAEWNSRAMVEIIFAIEDRFGFQMTGAEMESIDGMRSLIAVVSSHIGGQETGA